MFWKTAIMKNELISTKKLFMAGLTKFYVTKQTIFTPPLS